MIKANIRNITPEDYYNVCNLGAKSYYEFDKENNYYEGEKSFISKMRNCVEGCFVADVDGIIGYIISFPYVIGKSCPIDYLFEPICNPNCWYIHDLCISKDFRKKGIATSLVKAVLNNHNIFCLTSVNNSENFWEKFGFRSFFELKYCNKKAKYMILIKN